MEDKSKDDRSYLPAADLWWPMTFKGVSLKNQLARIFKYIEWFCIKEEDEIIGGGFVAKDSPRGDEIKERSGGVPTG
ncbi:hypothetical protein A2U01_0084715 [Trifolium medium]|uniref:Uncharacterized protein n=1 Tax=Trifolium medium TaxID=97028 RepID=A0A392TRB6_9FABA|nr:hypothetical protein [Trifolium medium]